MFHFIMFQQFDLLIDELEPPLSIFYSIVRFTAWDSPTPCHRSRSKLRVHNLPKYLMQGVEIDNTRTTSFQPQSNATIQRMNRTLLSMLPKSLDQDQSDRFTTLPFVSMASRSSIHQSKGFTPFLPVFGLEMSLPLNPVYAQSAPSEQPPLSK